jgi:hypothetical protein
VGATAGQKGPFDSYVYNNTIYCSADIANSMVAIANSTRGLMFANNIVYLQKKTVFYRTLQFNPANLGAGVDQNIDMLNNIYFSENSWPSQYPFDAAPLYGNPMFAAPGGMTTESYIPSNKAFVNQGIDIPKLAGDEIGLKPGLRVTHDILGNPITGTPTIGAIQVAD